MSGRVKRQLGDETFEYTDYHFRVIAWWEDRRYGTETTPQYVVKVSASREDSETAGETFTAMKKRPIQPSRSLLDKLLRRRKPQVHLSTVVRDAVSQVQDDIDSMYEDIGVREHKEEFEVAMDAMTAVESWTEVPE